MINLYTTSTIGNYKTGTVTCTKNSPTVTGTGTTWKEIVNPGDILTLNDDKFYIISAVNSNTSLTLDKNFAENTATNVSYRILLNTAAHFPSDTAAKVERALEQLSDINEAAINNDRTVTAATKLEGKGLTSTAGTIDLNPPTVNSNTGGQINFHYNQSANTTSSIVENASGQIRVNGDLNLTGDITSPIRTTNSTIFMKNTSITVGTAPSATKFSELWLLHPTDSSFPLGFVGTVLNTENTVKTRLRVMRNSTPTKSADIAVCVDDDGNVFTEAPTPATNDNSTKIATTAFVNNRLPYTTGTWTPTLAGSETAGTFTYHSGWIGFYLKIGKLVYVSWYIRATIDTSKALPTGQVIIKGLPFVARYSHAFNANTTFSKHVDIITVSDSTTYIKFRAYKALTTSACNYVDIHWGSTEALETWVPSSIDNGQYFFGNILYVTD